MDTPAIFQETSARHEEVRHFVETHLGESYRVTRIRERTETRYQPPLNSIKLIHAETSPPFILIIAEIEFSVDAMEISGITEADVKVLVKSDGTLHIGRTQIITPTPPFI
jgi:hypothetical protein